MSLKDAIREAADVRDRQESIQSGEQQSSKKVNAASKQDGKPAEEEIAALTVKVPLRWRIHWLISAKQERTTLTAVITEALTARYGLPKD
jgi:hypothetical protein